MAACLRTSYTASLANSKMDLLCVRLAKMVPLFCNFSIFVFILRCGLFTLSNNQVRDYRSVFSSGDDYSGDDFPRVNRVHLRLGTDCVVKDLSSIADASWTYHDQLVSTSLNLRQGRFYATITFKFQQPAWFILVFHISDCRVQHPECLATQT